MPNRHTRDQLILNMLRVVHLPNLETEIAPDGVVKHDAIAIDWLQEILDFWHHICPFSATVRKIDLNCIANANTIILPPDFILDVRNGYIVQQVPGDMRSFARTTRVSLQKLITRQLMCQNVTSPIPYPVYYSIVGDNDDPLTQNQTMEITPTPTIATVGSLRYYQLPPRLQAGQKPKFPNDYACVEYLRIRALEWAGIYEPGTAHKFCEKIVSTMKVAGMMNEPEDDEIPFDELRYRKGGQYVTSYTWMGPQ